VGIPIPGPYPSVGLCVGSDMGKKLWVRVQRAYPQVEDILGRPFVAVNLRKSQSHKTWHVNVNRPTLNEILIYLLTVNFFFSLTTEA